MADHLFRTLTDCFVIIHERGVYKQCPLAVRKDELYAKAKGGYVRLSSNGATSASCRYVDLIGIPDHRWRVDDLGRLKYIAPPREIAQIEEREMK